MDVDAYLARIGASRTATLAELHEAHVRNVPFEDYDIHLRVPLSLDVDDLYAKIVQRRRGGFCYELNGLFAALLRELGHEVTLVSAFTVGADGVRGADFDHLRLLVGTPSGRVLVDVGNGSGQLRPVPLIPGEHGDVQVHRDGELWWTAERHSDGRWERGWSWTAQPRELVDFTGRCHYQQHDPDSHFVARRLASLPTPGGRISLLNGAFAEVDDAGRTERTLDAEQERAVLAQRFGIVVAGTWEEPAPLPS
ncbi:arylamine N-acetyltransferase family protein [Pseudonocardia sp. GCM10023141]|uniref:arylamine N-acetyltransferase family protein n=1 Tax=Pseudonocardia sp. GCM10023141 TaxID=3252653 RepID=UPI00362052A4